MANFSLPPVLSPAATCGAVFPTRPPRRSTRHCLVPPALSLAVRRLSSPSPNPGAARSGGGICEMLLCCAPSPHRVQAFPPLHPTCVLSSSGEQGRSEKSKRQRVKAQSFRADGYLPAAEGPAEDLLGSAARPLQLPDAEALASWLRSCGSLAGVRGVHAVALRSLGSLGVFVSNNLISAYVEFDEVMDARKVFDGMHERSVVSWMAMMNGYRKLGCHGEVRWLFLDMLASGVQGNSLTFVCLLKSRRRYPGAAGSRVHCERWVEECDCGQRRRALLRAVWRCHQRLSYLR